VQEFDKVDVPPLVYYGGSYAVATRSPQAAPWQTVHTQRKGGFSEDSLHYLIGLLDLQLTHHIAPVIRDLGFQEPRELQLLMILGLGENRTLAEVNSLVPTLEPHFADAIPASLKTLGFIRISADGRLSITDQGRQRLVLGTVAAKSKEADALGALDEAERLALRHMLKRLIVSTDVN
jgi:3-hydroxy-9,10-secoandrosta-1,3,5(10)-triene-9,17-dione monooxygenase reductase component